jgi:hypothetical protein
MGEDDDELPIFSLIASGLFVFTYHGTVPVKKNLQMN